MWLYLVKMKNNKMREYFQVDAQTVEMVKINKYIYRCI